MQTLRNALEQSEKDGAAIGHFNVADLVLLKAVAAAGRELKVPVAVGASEGERESSEQPADRWNRHREERRDAAIQGP